VPRPRPGHSLTPRMSSGRGLLRLGLALPARPVPAPVTGKSHSEHPTEDDANKKTDPQACPHTEKNEIDLDTRRVEGDEEDHIDGDEGADDDPGPGLAVPAPRGPPAARARLRGGHAPSIASGAAAGLVRRPALGPGPGHLRDGEVVAHFFNLTSNPMPPWWISHVRKGLPATRRSNWPGE